jgi:hypothetical protein
MVAIRVADLVSPAGRGLGKDGRPALVAARAGRIGTGDLVVFLKPVAVAAAVVRRDGRVQAAGHPADRARLGLAEELLDALCGTADVIGQVARAAVLKGKVKGKARRAMTAGLAIRFVLLMTLMDADYAEVMAALIGTWLACRGSGPMRCRPRRWPRRGGRRSGRSRWSGCGICCWPPSTASTAITITGPSPWGTWTFTRSTGR